MTLLRSCCIVPVVVSMLMIAMFDHRLADVLSQSRRGYLSSVRRIFGSVVPTSGNR